MGGRGQGEGERGGGRREGQRMNRVMKHGMNHRHNRVNARCSRGEGGEAMGGQCICRVTKTGNAATVNE